MVKLGRCLTSIASYGRIRIERLQQLDDRLARAQADRLDALIGDDFAIGLLESQYVNIQFKGRVEIFYHDRHMIERIGAHATTSCAVYLPKTLRSASEISPTVA